MEGKETWHSGGKGWMPFFSHSKCIFSLIASNNQEFLITVVRAITAWLREGTCVFSCESWEALNKPSSSCSSKSGSDLIQWQIHSWANGQCRTTKKMLFCMVSSAVQRSKLSPPGVTEAPRKGVGRDGTVKGKERITTWLRTRSDELWQDLWPKPGLH